MISTKGFLPTSEIGGINNPLINLYIVSSNKYEGVEVVCQMGTIKQVPTGEKDKKDNDITEPQFSSTENVKIEGGIIIPIEKIVDNGLVSIKKIHEETIKVLSATYKDCTFTIV